MTDPRAHPHSPSRPEPQPVASRRRGTPLGATAVILLGLALTVQLVASIVTRLVVFRVGITPEEYGALVLGSSILQGLLAVAGIVVGALGLAARDRPRALAGIGLGGGVVVLFGVVVAQVGNLAAYVVAR